MRKKNQLVERKLGTGLSNQHVLYLLNTANGRVFPWTALLSTRKGFIDCTADGVPIDPDQVKADDPWIMQQTKGLAGRMRAAGADDRTMEDMGNYLTEETAKRYRQLEYKHAKERYRLQGTKSEGFTGALVRIQNRIDEMAEEAHREIKLMGRMAGLK